MDALDLLTGSFRSEPVAHVEAHVEAAQEEKREDNPSSSGGSSSDSSTDDMDFPSTQLLAPLEPLDEENKAAEPEEPLWLPPQPPMSPAGVKSPVKPRSSPIKSRASPAKAHASPVKPRASPVKVRSSPVKIRSPAKPRASPVKARSPAKPRSSPLKARSPAKPRSSPVKAPRPPVALTPLVDQLVEAEKKDEEKKEETKKKEEKKVDEKKEEKETDDTPEEFRAKGAEGKFTRVFPVVAKLVETGGWQIAQGHNTLFCAMPGVQFFNFKPNINVFDSKMKACWKFIQIAGEKKEDNEDQELWDLLWPIAQKEFGWFTMMCGPETWYVKPDTKFESFLPNETIFQTKKRAVLKCLAVEVGDIELGDSAEGHQVVAFAPRAVQPPLAPAPKKVKTSLFKTPSPAVKTVRRTPSNSSMSSTFITPTQRVSPATSVKRKLASSASKLSSKSSSSKKAKGGKAGAKKPATKRKKKVVSDTASDISKADEFNFTPPEFRCSFGIVYSRLQDEGWGHKCGTFEYDYFSPTYTDATKEVGVNYFQSQATLENFLKTSGTWQRIEDELREEHEQVVNEEREKALERHHQRLEQQAARKRNLAMYGAPALAQAPAATKPKPKSKKPRKATPKRMATPPPTQTLYQAEVEAAKAAEAEERMSRLPNIKFGTIVKKLVGRGWYYRPGRFEYDYFKPSANPKTAVSGEDRFESTSALEIYLKTTGLWEELVEEVEQDELNKIAATHPAIVNHNHSEPPLKRSKLESPPPESAQSPKRALTGGVQKEDVKALTNDIWANSHEFDFNE
ncbi:hypothetical protein PF008_g11925 [Phytophthora fragariae]|uniref:Uncharacterized protein n=1 Tax=Phytophthora fragariae TaxID=53985 RepID=A0A6G0RPC9_9STRA|nr:hypothetical protein PF008_g11925 [Phytophthora fragariae]